ncbi:MAG: hypothetical protein WC333_08680 [Dehalococcoidia bacterium]
MPSLRTRKGRLEACPLNIRPILNYYFAVAARGSVSLIPSLSRTTELAPTGLIFL